jgi:superfamily II DNA or RNA helicase
LEVIPRYLTAHVQLAGDAGIQDVFRTLAGHAGRTTAIADEVAAAYAQGHKVLVLTERTEHLEAIAAALAGRTPTLFTLHGRLSKKQRTSLIGELEALATDAPRVLLATGKLVGEGFDHPPLDTLVLAMPISWKGTLQQYAGRLHREHAGKTRVRIIDFVDTGHPALVRMWGKRQRGYQAMGYNVAAAPVSGNLDFGAAAPGDVAAAITAAGTKAGSIDMGTVEDRWPMPACCSWPENHHSVLLDGSPEGLV